MLFLSEKQKGNKNNGREKLSIQYLYKTGNTNLSLNNNNRKITSSICPRTYHATIKSLPTRE